MESKELGILERIARNLPALKMIYRRVDYPEIGTVYLAWGKDGMGQFHGLWGFGCDGVGDVISMARILEFKHGSSVKQVRAALLHDALQTAKDMKPKGLLSRQHWKYNG